MDWKLTKSLYILVFLLVNIGLLVMLYDKQQDNVREIESTPNMLEETNIDVSAIPEHDPKKLNILTGEPENFNEVEEVDTDSVESTNAGQRIIMEFDEGDSAPEMDRGALESYKAESVYRGSEYEYDDVMSNDEQLLFNQYHEEYPIFNNDAARLVFRGDGIDATSYEQAYVTNLRENSYSVPTPVRDPKKCVIDLYQRERISEDAVIENVRLGYYVILNDGEQIMLRPKWEFKVTDQGVEKIIYIDAISETEDIIERE